MLASLCAREGCPRFFLIFERLYLISKLKGRQKKVAAAANCARGSRFIESLWECEKSPLLASSRSICEPSERLPNSMQKGFQVWKRKHQRSFCFRCSGSCCSRCGQIMQSNFSAFLVGEIHRQIAGCFSEGRNQTIAATRQDNRIAHN